MVIMTTFSPPKFITGISFMGQYMLVMVSMKKRLITLKAALKNDHD